MTREEYLKMLFEKFNAGEISEECYDHGVMNADVFCEEEGDE